MSNPNLQPVQVDRDGRPIPQFWSARLAAYSALHGDHGVLSAAPPQTRFVDTTAPLGASATFVGLTRTAAIHANFITARAFANVAGELFIEQSRDGTVWRSTVGHRIAVAAGETRQLSVGVVAGFWRVRYVNGATAQTEFELLSAEVTG